MSCAGCTDCSLTQMAGAISPFEIHLTVSPDTNPHRFVDVCENLKIKSLLVDNWSSDSIYTDFMTRSVVRGCVEDAKREMEKISLALANNGIKVVRHKIETVPWIYDQVKKIAHGQDMPYFETHIETPMISGLYTIVRRMGGYLSQNRMKRDIGMVTFRLSSVDEIEFRLYVKSMRDKMQDAGLTVSREIIELTFYDDNLTHDDPWLNG